MEGTEKEEEIVEKNLRIISLYQKLTIGISFFSEKDGILKTSEIPENDFSSTLRRIMNIYEPSLILLSPNFQCDVLKEAEFDEIEKVTMNGEIYSYSKGVNSIKELIFTVPSIEQEKLTKQIHAGIIDISSKVVVGSISAIVQFIIDKRRENPVVSSIGSMDSDACCGFSISRNDMESIQIMCSDKHPSIHNPTSTKDGLSLFTLLNRCSTSMGKSKLRHWFFVQSIDMSFVNRRLDTIEQFTSPPFHAIVNELVEKMHEMSDVRSILVLLQKGTCKRKNWQQLAKSLGMAASLYEYIEEHTLPPQIVELFDNYAIAETITTLRSLSQKIEATIDFSPTKQQQEVHVKDECDARLRSIRESYNQLDKTLDSVARKLIDELPERSKVTTLGVVYIPQLGFLTTVHKTNGLTIKDLPKDFMFSFETDTHFYCKNPRMTDLDTDLGDVYQDILSRELEIINALSDKILEHSKTIHDLWDAIGELDAICSLSVVAVEGHWVKPIFTGKNLIIEEGRHPLLERCTETFIPNDTVIVDDEPRIQVITGPNGSGKSVYLKQVALIVFLAHIGSFVPAKRAELPLTDSIFTTFHNGISPCEPFSSSFAEDVKNLAHAMEKSTKNSLIIVDEFGKTSNHDDGSSLLCGFIQSMASRGDDCPIVLISTHFRDAVSEAVIDQSLFTRCTMSVKIANEDELSPERICFMYKIVKGEDNNSFGFNCAIRAGIPKEIVERAIEVSKCFMEGKEISPSPKCKDLSFDAKVKKALSLFFRWDTTGNPRALLAAIDETLQEEPLDI